MAAQQFPRICVVLRKSYGGAYIVMDSKRMGNDLCLAWPWAELAVMGAGQAAAILQRRATPEARAEFELDYTERLLNPYIAAERGYIDGVIEPADTRGGGGEGAGAAPRPTANESSQGSTTTRRFDGLVAGASLGASARCCSATPEPTAAAGSPVRSGRHRGGVVAEHDSGADARWPSGGASELLNLAVDLACVIGFDGRFQSLSDGWTELLGRPCGRLVGVELVQLVHPDDVAPPRLVRPGREDGAVSRFRNRLVAGDGTSRWLVWSAVAEPAEERFHAVARDITPQREAEEQMRESERRYHDLIESSHDIVQSIDPDGHFEFVNRSWHQHLGYTPEELAGLTLFDIVDEVDHDHCSLLIGQIMSGKSFETGRGHVRRQGRAQVPRRGQRHRTVQGRPVRRHPHVLPRRERAQAGRGAWPRSTSSSSSGRSPNAAQRWSRARSWPRSGGSSAGMAHELNNPAAAALRGAVRLREAVTQTCSGFIDLARLGLTDRETERPRRASLDAAAERAKVPDALDPVTRSDREGDIEDWLRDRVQGDRWELASDARGPRPRRRRSGGGGGPVHAGQGRRRAPPDGRRRRPRTACSSRSPTGRSGSRRSSPPSRTTATWTGRRSRTSTSTPGSTTRW